MLDIQKERSSGALIVNNEIDYFFFAKKAAAAGKMAKAPATIARMPPMTQPAPIETPSVLLHSFALANDGMTMNMKMPPKTKQTNATMSKMPENFSKALIFKSGKTTPHKTTTIPTRMKIQASNAKTAALYSGSNKPVDLWPKIATIPPIWRSPKSEL